MLNSYQKGNHLRLLRDGRAYFPALLAEIAKAEREIFLESYIFELDEVGLAVADALMQAAARGVDVKLHLDGFGSASFDPQWQEKLLAAGVKLLFFRPEIGRFFFDRTRLRRLHRKLVVIDKRIGFIGGINIISDTNQRPANLPPRYDYAIRIEGPTVLKMHAAVDRLWRQTAWMRLKREWSRQNKFPAARELAGHTRVHFVIRDNFRHRSDIETEYLAAIEKARHEILIANAYFLPGWRFRHALIDAAKRGVRVVLILQGVIDHLILHFATRGLYHQLLDAGIEIREYQDGFMHAKVAVIDGQWSTVGSSNIDPFSLLLAREANVFIDDIAFAAILRADLRRTLHESTTQITLEDLNHKRPIQRLLPWLCFGLVRIMMGISGYARLRYLE